jgi:hypothetical protein
MRETQLEESADSDDGDSAPESSSGEELDEERLDDDDFRLVHSVARAAAKKSDGIEYFHRIYGTVHLGHSDDPSKLACSRPLTLNYVRREDGASFPRPKCMDCFGKKAG